MESCVFLSFLKVDVNWMVVEHGLPGIGFIMLED